MRVARPAPLAILLVAVAACLGDPVGPETLVVAIDGAGPDTLWLGAPGELVPSGVRLRITDDAGRPLPGASLTWEAVGRDARLVAPSTESNSAGLATAGWQLGTDAAEEQRLHVLVQTPRHHSEISIRARAVPHVVSQIRILIDTPFVMRVGDSLPVAVIATDPYGNVFPAPDVTRWVTDTAIGAVAGPTFIGGPHRGRASLVVASHGVAAAVPVQVTQYVAAIVPVSDTLRFSALGAQRRVAYVVRDDRGRAVADTAAAIALADTGVAQLTTDYVRALTPGLTALRLTLGTAAATIVVDVQQRIGSLRLLRDTIRLEALLDTTTVTPIVHDSLGSPIPNPVLEYNVSDSRVAKFAAGRTLQALAPGSAIVTVQDTTTGISTSAPVVVKQVIAKINVTPSQIAFDALGDTLTVSAVGEDRLGSVVVGAPLEFSVRDPGVASFQSGARLRSVTLGQTLAIVTDPETGIVATADVNVGQRVADLKLTADSVAFDALGDTVPLGFAARDRLGALATTATVTYSSSDPSVVSVSPEGVVRSQRNGSAFVVGESPDGPRDTLHVKVAQRVTALSLAADTVVLDALGDTLTLRLTARDRLGAVDPSPTVAYESSDPTVISVASDGLVRSHRNGSVAVIAQSPDGPADTAYVNVTQRVTRLDFTTDTVSFDAVGGTVPLGFVAHDRLGAVVASAAVTYTSSDPSIATVTADGVVESQRNGSALVVGQSADGAADTVSVIVSQRVASLTLSADSIVFDALLDTARFSLVGRDRLGALVSDAADRVNYFSTNSSVIALSPSGVAHSTGNGAALVVAQSTDGPADTVRIRVSQRVASVRVDRDSVVFTSLNAEQPIVGSPLDRLGSAVANAPVSFAVADSAVARVEESGRIRALSNGSTRVSVSSEGVTVPVEVLVEQRAVRVAVPSDTIQLNALSDSATITGTALDSLGSPVAGQLLDLSIGDSAIAEQVGPTTIRARSNGTTGASFAVAGLSANVVIVVKQIATTVNAQLTFGKPIVTLPLNAVVPITCEAFDGKGFAIPEEPVLVASGSGTVTGSGCKDLRVSRSGIDTLSFALGTEIARVPIIMAVAPVAKSSGSGYVVADTLPGAPGNTWAPSAHRNAGGQLEVYYTAFSGVRDSSGFTRGDLHRLIWLGSNQFRYDSIAIAHDNDICSPQGQGIENMVIVPRAESPGWRMLYAAGSNACFGWQVFSAVSSDGRHWVKEPGIRLSNGGTAAVGQPPWPAGEGMVVDQLANGEWRMIVSTYEHIDPPENKWQITEWRSVDQLSWTYVGTVLTTRDMPTGWQGSVYSPTIRQVSPGLWRMLFTADGRGTPGSRSAIWSAVSTDHSHWQIEGEVAGDVTGNLFYAAILDDQVVFIRNDGGVQRLGIATVTMP